MVCLLWSASLRRGASPLLWLTSILLYVITCNSIPFKHYFQRVSLLWFFYASPCLFWPGRSERLSVIPFSWKIPIPCPFMPHGLLPHLPLPIPTPGSHTVHGAASDALGRSRYYVVTNAPSPLLPTALALSPAASAARSLCAFVHPYARGGRLGAGRRFAVGRWFLGGRVDSLLLARPLFFCRACTTPLLLRCGCHSPACLPAPLPSSLPRTCLPATTALCLPAEGSVFSWLRVSFFLVAPEYAGRLPLQTAAGRGQLQPALPFCLYHAGSGGFAFAGHIRRVPRCCALRGYHTSCGVSPHALPARRGLRARGHGTRGSFRYPPLRFLLLYRWRLPLRGSG